MIVEMCIMMNNIDWDNKFFLNLNLINMKEKLQVLPSGQQAQQLIEP